MFWVALPLTAAVIAVTLAATRGYTSVISKGTYDWIGLLLGATGITLLTYGLQNSSTSWTATGTWGAIVAGVVLLGVFGVVESRIAHPLVDFSLWKERLFSGGFFAESAVGFVYIPFLVFIGSLYFINVLGYSPGKASSVILITTGICMVFEPPAGRWVDKVGPGLPITVSLLMQAVALAWMGLSFSPTTTLGQMVIPLALMGIGVGISLPACNTAGMSAVDPERAGMGSGLMQMTFNIPAALGVGLVTSIIGGLTASKVGSGLGSRADLNDAATRYADAVQDGDKARADEVLTGLPQDSIDAIKHAVTSAASGAITVSMLVLAAVALAGAIFAWVVIGRRRTPDHVETTNAAAV